MKKMAIFKVVASICYLLLSVSLVWAEWETADSRPAELISLNQNQQLRMSLSSLTAGSTLMTNETAMTPEIGHLARALMNDPALIFEYVRNHIEYIPTDGCVNGATGCLLAGRGNDWDQSALLTALLRASGFVTRYAYAPVGYTIEDMQDWLGVEGTNALDTLLAQGGIVHGPEPAHPDWYVMYRVWVEVKIDENWFCMDPSYKEFNSFAKVDLPNVMNYSSVQFTNNALSGATLSSDYVENVNETNIALLLTGYATNLVRYIQTNNPYATMEDIIGGRRISPVTVTNFSTELPKVQLVGDDFKESWDIFPDEKCLRLTIQYPSATPTINISLKGYEIAGKRISLFYKLSDGNKPQLRVEGKVVDTGAPMTTGTVDSLSIITEHAYSGFNRTNSFSLICGSKYVIIHDFETASSRITQRANSLLSQDIASGLSNDSEAVFGGGMNITALIGLEQWNLSRKLIAQLSNVVGFSHHFIGIIGQETGYYVDIPGSLVGGASFTNSALEVDAWCNANALLASALEHGTLEQSQGGRCASTIKLLQLNNQNGGKTFYATRNNWPSVCSNLVNYSSSLTNSITQYINWGCSFVLPENAFITNQDWVGIGYIRFKSNASKNVIEMAISGDLSGAYSGATNTHNYNYPLINSKAPLQASNIQNTTALDPVDLHSGNLLVEKTDLVIGSAPEPVGLSFSRYYDGGQKDHKGSLGFGWCNNYDISAKAVSHGNLGLGSRTPSDAAALIAQTYVTLDLMRGSLDVNKWACGVLAAKWGMDQLVSNSVVVQVGGRSLEYAKSPDGSYIPAPGVTAALTRQGSSYVMTERFDKTYSFNLDGSLSNWQDSDGNTIYLAYNSSSNLVSVSNSFGRMLYLSYDTSGCVKKIHDNDGRYVYYFHTGSNLTTVIDVESNEWTYAYNSSNCLVAEFDPMSRIIISNQYDVSGTVQAQMNGNSNFWNFYISGWRGVEEDPEGNFVTHFFDKDGRNIGLLDAVGNRSYRYYDTLGHLVSNIDAAGRSTIFHYDYNNNITNTINALTNNTLFTYDGKSRLKTITDSLGNVTRYRYDSENHITNVVDAMGNLSILSYNPKGLLKKIIEGNGLRTANYTYDSFGNQITASRTDGGTISNTYDATGNLLTSADSKSHNTYSWNKRRQLVSEIDSKGFVVSNVYNSKGLLLRSVDRCGNTNKTSYTVTGKPFRLTLADGGIIQYNYDSLDRVATITDPLGRVTSNRYDKAGRKIGAVDALGGETKYAFDSNGLIVAQTNALGKVSTFVYDELNRLIQSIDSLNHTNSFDYDAAGRHIATTDAEGLFTQFQYDSLGQKITKITPDGVAEHYEYNALGNLTAFVNGAGNRMTFGYDGMGRLLAATNAVGTVTTYGYDDAGNRISRQDANGATTLYGYDSVYNLTNISYPGGVSVRFAYNGNRLATNVVDATGSTRWQYDRMNRLTNVVASGAGVPTRQVAYTYDLSGNRASISFADGKTVSYGFDSLNRLTNVTDWVSRNMAFAYDSLGRETGILYPNAVSGALEWDDADRLTRICYASGGSNFVDRTFTLSPAGDLTAMQVTAGLMPQLTPAVRRFSQNAADELTQIAQKAVPDAPTEIIALLSGDLNGNLTNVAGLLLAYDADNRITNMVSGSMTTAITYDGQGNRVKVGTGSGGQTNITWFVLDYADPLRRPLAELDIAGQPVRWFVWGKGLVAQVEAAGAIHYAHGDSQGSTLAFTDAVGTPTDQWFYSPYGSVLHRTGTSDTPFQWLGGYGVRCQDDGIYLTLYRLYNAELMRFTSADPIGLAGGANLYAYCGGNPLTLMDPEGKCGNENRIEFFNQGYGPNQSYQIVGANERNLTMNDWQAVGPYYMGAGLSVSAIGASMIPGVGQAMDLATLNDSSAGFFWRGLAAASLAIDSYTGGFAPNASSIRYAAKSIANELPSTLARVVPGATTPVNLGRLGAVDVFVTAADDIAGMNAAQISQRLAIKPSSSYTVIEFSTPSSGLASPINRLDPGFVGGGRTAGGAREFVLPNGPLPPDASIRRVP